MTSTDYLCFVSVTLMLYVFCSCTQLKNIARDELVHNLNEEETKEYTRWQEDYDQFRQATLLFIVGVQHFHKEK